MADGPVVLSLQEIESVLYEQHVARIGCQADGRPYIVPIAYAYDGACIYAYSAEGLKLEGMRRNPFVCVQVDIIESLSEWRSVIGWGTFEELHDERARDALERIADRLRTVFIATGATSAGEGRTFVTRSGRYGIVFRILLTEKTGRAERSEAP